MVSCLKEEVGHISSELCKVLHVVTGKTKMRPKDKNLVCKKKKIQTKSVCKPESAQNSL